MFVRFCLRTTVLSFLYPTIDRYIKEAGIGTFGKVIFCEDIRMKRMVAIKVVRNIRKYTDSAKIESEILEGVNRADPQGTSLILRLYSSFEWHGHYCMVCEPLGPSIYDYIKQNNHGPLPLYCVQSFADQLLRAVAFMHEMRLIHTDLKLENILLVSREPFVTTEKTTKARDGKPVLAPRKTDIKIIDFGGATYDYEHKSALINTRQYRSPEVILGLGWSTPSDVWSVGCILMEMYTGELLFQTHDNAEHLALMEKILGPFPSTILRSQQSPEIRRYFDSNGHLRYHTSHRTSSESLRHVHQQPSLSEIIHGRDTVFMDLVRSLLQIDPNDRITAKAALNHRFFSAVRGTIEISKPAWLPQLQRNNRYLPTSRPKGSPGDDHSDSGASHSRSASPSRTDSNVHANTVIHQRPVAPVADINERIFTKSSTLPVKTELVSSSSGSSLVPNVNRAVPNNNTNTVTSTTNNNTGTKHGRDTEETGIFQGEGRTGRPRTAEEKLGKPDAILIQDNTTNKSTLHVATSITTSTPKDSNNIASSTGSTSRTNSLLHSNTTTTTASTVSNSVVSNLPSINALSTGNRYDKSRDISEISLTGPPLTNTNVTGTQQQQRRLSGKGEDLIGSRKREFESGINYTLTPTHSGQGPEKRRASDIERIDGGGGVRSRHDSDGHERNGRLYDNYENVDGTSGIIQRSISRGHNVVNNSRRSSGIYTNEDTNDNNNNVERVNSSTGGTGGLLSLGTRNYDDSPKFKSTTVMVTSTPLTTTTTTTTTLTDSLSRLRTPNRDTMVMSSNPSPAVVASPNDENSQRKSGRMTDSILAMLAGNVANALSGRWMGYSNNTDTPSNTVPSTTTTVIPDKVTTIPINPSTPHGQNYGENTTDADSNHTRHGLKTPSTVSSSLANLSISHSGDNE